MCDRHKSKKIHLEFGSEKLTRLDNEKVIYIEEMSFHIDDINCNLQEYFD
jgi:hypothetical protein